MFIRKKSKQFVVKSYEEELGSELFVVIVPVNVPESEVYAAFDKASKYTGCFEGGLPEEEGVIEYDEHFMEAVEKNMKIIMDLTAFLLILKTFTVGKLKAWNMIMSLSGKYWKRWCMF